jgi:hypothetical protein
VGPAAVTVTVDAKPVTVVAVQLGATVGELVGNAVTETVAVTVEMTVEAGRVIVDGVHF